MTLKLKLNSNKQRAFTLVEVMVAMVIFSIGLLGLAGLQSLGITNNQTAFNRTIAIQQAYNMSDRMRDNKVGVDAFNYDALGTITPGLVTNCLLAVCTAGQLATFDHFEWNTNNSTQLPQGRGSVTLVSRTPSNTQLRVCIMWNELKLPGLPAAPDCSGVAAYDPTTQFKFYSLLVDL